MHLSPASVEDAIWTVTSDEDLISTPEVAIGTQNVWYPAEWVDAVVSSVRDCRVIVAGPDAPVTAEAVLVERGDHRTWVRIPDGPKRVVREGSRLFCR